MDPRLLRYRYDRLFSERGAFQRACRDLDESEDGIRPLVGQRVVKFYGLHYRYVLYEPLVTYDELRAVVELNWRLREAGVPDGLLLFPTVVFRVFQSARTAVDGRLQPPGAEETTHEMHSVAIDGGWEDELESLRFINSWGPAWGKNGTGLLTREYLDRHMIEASVQRQVTGPSPTTWAAAKAAKGPGAAWMIPVPRWKHRVHWRGGRYVIKHYDTISGRGGSVDVIELLNGISVRLGWVHMRHFRDDAGLAVSEMTEFFVWPWFRRQGYGRWLERLALEKAKESGADEVRAPYHDADALAQVKELPGARQFAEHAGYEWKDESAELPPRMAMVTKRLSQTPGYRARIVLPNGESIG